MTRQGFRAALVFYLLASPALSHAQESAIGSSALQSSKTGSSMRWQTWVFAGAIVAGAAIGITFILLNQGSHAHS